MENVQSSRNHNSVQVSKGSNAYRRKDAGNGSEDQRNSATMDIKQPKGPLRPLFLGGHERSAVRLPAGRYEGDGAHISGTCIG
jgi:hypothetical protein